MSVVSKAISSVNEGTKATHTLLITKPHTEQGLIQGGWIGWVANPLGCGVSIISFVWALTDLLEQAILVNKLYDETQINPSDRDYRGRTLTVARACGLTQSNYGVLMNINQ